MSETKFYDVDGDKYRTSLEEDDIAAVPRIGELILWEVYTYKVKTILNDIEDMVVVMDVVRVMSVLHDIEDRITILHVRKVRDTEEFL